MNDSLSHSSIWKLSGIHHDENYLKLFSSSYARLIKQSVQNHSQPLKIVPTAHFRQDYKRAKKRGLDMSELEGVIRDLSEGVKLDIRYRDHPLTGPWQSFRECHIKPDWLLIYKIQYHKLILTLARTGTHADLFKK